LKLKFCRIPSSRFKFEKRRQLLIRTHNETLSIVAMRVSKIVRPPESTAETQPQLNAALLRLSAMISQYITRGEVCRFCSPQSDDKMI